MPKSGRAEEEEVEATRRSWRTQVVVVVNESTTDNNEDGEKNVHSASNNERVLVGESQTLSLSVESDVREDPQGAELTENNVGFEYSSLHTACFNKNWDLAEHLIRRGSGLRYRDKEKWGVLHMAIFNKAPLQIIRMLLERLPKTEINQGIDNGSTPVYLAAEKDVDPEVVRVLLENGADPNQPRVRRDIFFLDR